LKNKEYIEKYNNTTCLIGTEMDSDGDFVMTDFEEEPTQETKHIDIQDLKPVIKCLL